MHRTHTHEEEEEENFLLQQSQPAKKATGLHAEGEGRGGSSC